MVEVSNCPPFMKTMCVGGAHGHHLASDFPVIVQSCYQEWASVCNIKDIATLDSLSVM
jgi:hypothetical protein